MTQQRHFTLSENDSKAIRFLSDRVDARLLGEDKTSTVVTITRTGTFFDPRYGQFDITREMLLSMVKNFDAGVFGQDIVLDVSHKPSDGAAGFFRRLFLDGNKLRGEVELTPYGIDAIKKRGFIYLSAEFSDNFQDNEKREQHGPTLLGAALTPRPVIKHLDRVQLSEDALDGAPMTLISERLTKLLNEDLNVDKFKKLLLAALASFGLDNAVALQLAQAFETSAASLGDDEVKLKALAAQFEATGKTLSESIGSKNVTLSIQNPEPAKAGLTMDDVTKLLADNARTLAETQTATAKKLSDNQAIFKTALDGAESLKALAEPQLTALLSAGDLVTGEMSEDQVKALAQHQITLGSQMAINQQLSAVGYQVAGNARITIDDSNSVKSLQETIDKRLGLSDRSDSQRYSNTGGSLQPENQKLVDKVLAQFDQSNAAQLRAEHKMLAGGDGIVSDVAVPAVVERTVIREALHNLVGLQFVNSGTAAFASSLLVPYSYRDQTAAGRNSTRRYEGQAIQRAGVIQTSETAYPIPQKIAFEVSDELRYLTSNGMLDYNALSENVMNAARVIGEDTEHLIFNEVLNSSDEFGAVEVVNEVLTGTDGTNQVFVLANFPVVRPRAIFDLQGNAIGNVANAVKVEFDVSGYTTLQAFDGSGSQTAGNYYVLDYNLGEVYIVNQAGAIQKPAAIDNVRVSYSYSTNGYAYSTDFTGDADIAWDNFLYRYGKRKNVIEDDRYHMANFGLMSGAVMTEIERAKQFGANNARNGTSLSTDGNLGRVKDVPNFKTSTPGLNMGDQRVVIGERGQTRLRMMKPWSMGEMQDQKDANGRFTGKKEAYGDQFLVLHTPTQLKAAYTSIVLYSAAGRVARVNP